jgi:hypothetical protein
MNTALALIQAVEANGGRLAVEGETLVIRPKEAGLPLVDELRAHKTAILAALQARHLITSHNEEDSVGQALRSAFARWEDIGCVRGAGGWDTSSVGVLQLDFCRWAGHSVQPCTRRTFERLLADAGFSTTDGIVWGLMLPGPVEPGNAPGRLRGRNCGSQVKRRRAKSDQCGSQGLFEGVPLR